MSLRDAITRLVFGVKQIGSIAVGRRPWNLAISRDGRWLYVANGLSDDVSIVDVAARKVVRSFVAGRRPWGVALIYR